MGDNSTFHLYSHSKSQKIIVRFSNTRKKRSIYMCTILEWTILLCKRACIAKPLTFQQIFQFQYFWLSAHSVFNRNKWGTQTADYSFFPRPRENKHPRNALLIFPVETGKQDATKKIDSSTIKHLRRTILRFIQEKGKFKLWIRRISIPRINLLSTYLF